MERRQEPYDGFIMDHIRNARNYHVLDHANRKVAGFNPLCGDGLTLQLQVACGRIEDAAFQCECCGISMASASMMTDWVKGRTLGEVGRFVEGFAGRLAGRAEATPIGGSEMERALLATVREYPARAVCAGLPWTTLQSALNDERA